VGAKLAIDRLLEFVPEVKVSIVKQSTYVAGDKVKIAPLSETRESWSWVSNMGKWNDKIMTVRCTHGYNKYEMIEDAGECPTNSNVGKGWIWSRDMISGKVVIDDLKPEPVTKIVAQTSYKVGDTIVVKETVSGCRNTCKSFKDKGKTVVIKEVLGVRYKSAESGCAIRLEDIVGKVVTTPVKVTEVNGLTRHAEIGEYVRVETTSGHNLPAGYIGKVTRLSKTGVGYAFVDCGEHESGKCVRPDQYTILVGYEPIAVPVVEVKRYAKVGEYVKVTSREDGVDIGDICEVLSATNSRGLIYVRSKRKSNFSGSESITKLSQPFTYLSALQYVVLEGYKK
jgi:hypothetical protein